MCGRYTLVTPGEELARRFQLPDAPDVARYNVAPTQPAPVIRVREGARALAELRWGLVPWWSKELSIGARLINARAESVHTRPAFRDAFRRHRCLVPATGFFEWMDTGGAKQPWLLGLKDASPMAFAGLWDRWRTPEGTTIESFTIVTGPPNHLARPLHDRMPVILPEEAWDTWLDPGVTDPARLRALLVPYPAERMRSLPVSRRVNDVRNDDPGCLEPLTS